VCVCVCVMSVCVRVCACVCTHTHQGAVGEFGRATGGTELYGSIVGCKEKLCVICQYKKKNQERPCTVASLV
jgi:hypothetical protein